MTIYELIFEVDDKTYSTSVYADNKTPKNLQVEETTQNRLKLTNETTHKFIERILIYSYPLSTTIKKRLRKLIKLTNIPVKNFIAGVDTINEKPHEMYVVIS